MTTTENPTAAIDGFHDDMFPWAVQRAALTRGVPLITSAALSAAIRAADPVGETSLGLDAQTRLEFLRDLARSLDGLLRRELVADDGMLERLASVATSSPNAARAVEIVRRAAMLSRATGKALRVPPIVLAGPPGTTLFPHVRGLPAPGRHSPRDADRPGAVPGGVERSRQLGVNHLVPWCPYPPRRPCG